MSDEIEVHRLRVTARIGVTEEERATPQGLMMSLRIFPEGGLGGVDDEIGRTTDYAVVAQEVRDLCATRTLKLIETLAEEIADLMMDRHGPCEVEVEVRKFVLPDCDYVAVKIRRSPGGKD